MRGKNPQVCPFAGLSCSFLVITNACLYFLEKALDTNGISHLSVVLSSFASLAGARWQVSCSMCTHILFFQDTFLISAHDLKSPRFIKEYFMQRSFLVLQGLILTWHLPLLISLYGFLNLPENTSCTSPNSKKPFFNTVNEWCNCCAKLQQ